MLQPLAGAHRFSVDEILDWHGSLEAAFNAGDYLLVAQHAVPGSELAGQSLILCGMVEQGVGALQACVRRCRFSDICLAYGLWVLNQHENALTLLSGPNAGAEATALESDLKRLILAPVIPVVTIAVALPIYTAESGDVRELRQTFGQFVCTHVATQLAEDVDATALTTPLNMLLDGAGKRPLFIYSGGSQWILPRAFAECSIPKVTWLHDSDRFFYRMSGNFGLFDIAMTNVSQEHYELTRTCNAFAASNFFCDAMSSPCPPSSICPDKPIDLVFTGAGLESPQTDRAHFIARLAELGQRFNVRIFDGHLGEPAFLDLLGSAKFAPVVNRYRGCPSPRWMQALSRGTFVLHPERTTFERFGPGCFPFRPERMVEDIAQHIGRWNNNIPGSAYNPLAAFPDIQAALAPRQMSRSALFERTLKCAAMLVLMRRHGVANGVGPSGRQRTVWPAPSMDAWMYGFENILAKTDAIVEQKAREIQQEDDIGINNIAMTIIQQAILLRDRGQPVEAVQRYARALAIVDDGVRCHPNSFALRWNAAHWRMFFGGDVRSAREQFLAIGADFAALSFKPSESDLGFGFRGADPVFWEYGYGDLILHAAVRAGSRAPASADRHAIDCFIFATLHGYLGLIDFWAGDVKSALRSYLEALSFSPRNAPIHQLALEACLALLSGGLQDEDKEAVEAITVLAGDVPTVNPRVLLTHIAPVLTVAREFNRPEMASKFLEAWWPLRRVVDEPSGAKYFPRNAGEIDHLLRERDRWPQQLSDDVCCGFNPGVLQLFRDIRARA